MRMIWPGLAAVLVLVALWPLECVEAEGGPTLCQSALSLPLPWGATADSLGIAAALVGAILTFIGVTALVRRR
jgi:hypothetical protein